VAFGQQSGPPASAKQLKYLLSLVQDAGHEGFRDARHPLGLTQRQAGGKFSTREASELIDRLVAGELDEVDDDGPPPGTVPAGSRTRPTTGAANRTPGARPVDRRAEIAAERAQQRLDDQRAELIAGVPADDLVAELERRGWTCIAP
jgi:hypothetical protein